MQQIKNDEISHAGRILGGNYSEALVNRVRERLRVLREFVLLNPPVIPYLCAWKEDDRVIWYEFAGDGFCDLLRCD